MNERERSDQGGKTDQQNSGWINLFHVGTQTEVLWRQLAINLDSYVWGGYNLTGNDYQTKKTTIKTEDVEIWQSLFNLTVNVVFLC